MAGVIRRVGPLPLGAVKPMPPFQALARAIIYQQLAGKAATAILNRFTALYAPKKFPSPKDVLSTSAKKLRTAGISARKASYLHDLAGKCVSGVLPLRALPRMKDEDIAAQLTAVKGIGEWTAHMFLIFPLGRPDVLPVGDYGLRKAVQRAYGLRSLPDAEKMRRIALPWRPYATLASWYLWRSLDGAD